MAVPSVSSLTVLFCLDRNVRDDRAVSLTANTEIFPCLSYHLSPGRPLSLLLPLHLKTPERGEGGYVAALG
jgi:hypothetical protein